MNFFILIIVIIYLLTTLLHLSFTLFAFFFHELKKWKKKTNFETVTLLGFEYIYIAQILNSFNSFIEKDYNFQRRKKKFSLI